MIKGPLKQVLKIFIVNSSTRLPTYLHVYIFDACQNCLVFVEMFTVVDLFWKQ